MDVFPRDRRPTQPITSLLHSALCVVVATSCPLLSGCGTTRSTDSARTATEQLLITDAIDDAVAQLNLDVLSGREVYFDSQYLEGAVDKHYMVSSLRQHLLASGCILKENRDDATYVVEARSGAVGTDRHDVMIGVPSVNMPTFLPSPVALPASIPEIPLAKNTKQRGVVKLAVFAYNRETGRRVWQSGIEPVSSFAKDSWVLGAGPFRKSTINDGTSFVGDSIPIIGEEELGENEEKVALTRERVFRDGFVQPATEDETQLATHVSDAPSETDPPVAETTPAPVSSPLAASSAPPATLPENAAAVPIASSSVYALPSAEAKLPADTMPQDSDLSLPPQAVVQSRTVNVSGVDARFAPRPAVPSDAPAEVVRTEEIPPAEHDQQVADSKSPLEKLWPGYWFKRNHSTGGQAAD